MKTSQATVRTWLPSKHGVSFDPLTLASQNKNQNQFLKKRNHHRRLSFNKEVYKGYHGTNDQ